MIFSEKFFLKTKGFNDILNLTEKIREIIKKSPLKEGICLISCPGSTAGITTLEYEDGLIKDLKNLLEKLIPQGKDYFHCQKWGDCNSYAHLRSALIKPFLTIAFEEKKPVLGTWQQIVLIDFDNQEREREIIVKLIGE